MAVTGVENGISAYGIAYSNANRITNSGAYGDYKSRTEKSSSASFAQSVNKAVTKKESVVDEYKRKHPKEAGTVDGQVNSGKAVLKKNGADKVSREDMTMEEYKQFFTKLMNGIPFDSSQQMDVEIWNISEKGWEQMKNDPEYEAWVLGYTAQDRAIHNPFASMPGYSANLHTEQFGASIEEHLGQSVPMNRSGSKASSASDEEDWWEKRHKKLEEFLEQQEKKAVQRRASAQSRNQQAQLMQMQMQMMQNAGYQQLVSGYMGGGVPASLAGAFLQTGAAGMFYGF